MKGMGILRGLRVTFGHFFDSFIDDIRWGGRRYNSEEGLDFRRSADARGVFTVQYPEEKLPTPEEFRYLPFLVYEEGPNGEKDYRCTSCGICAKVCPPQCIWIERTSDPTTGKPVPAPKEFYIDVDICMNCGFCAEYCPFDAIKMDHVYEITSFDRFKENIYNLEKLGRPLSYYASIRPENYQREEEARAEKERAKSAKATASAAPTGG